MIELLSVIVLLGILSSVIAPRFLSRQGFSEYAVRDQIITAARLAQQRAMYDRADGACYRLDIFNDLLTVRDADGNAIGPSEDWLNGIAIDGVSNITISFNSLGSPMNSDDCSGSASQRTINVVGESTLPVCFYSTGYFSAGACE